MILKYVNENKPTLACRLAFRASRVMYSIAAVVISVNKKQCGVSTVKDSRRNHTMESIPCTVIAIGPETPQ